MKDRKKTAPWVDWAAKRMAHAAERDAVSRDLRRRINAVGRWMINLCPMPAGHVFRVVLTNPLHTEARVDELLAHLETCAAAQGRTPGTPGPRRRRAGRCLAN